LRYSNRNNRLSPDIAVGYILYNYHTTTCSTIWHNRDVRHKNCYVAQHSAVL